MTRYPTICQTASGCGISFGTNHGLPWEKWDEPRAKKRKRSWKACLSTIVYISENLSTVLFQEMPSAVPSPSAVPQSLRPPHNSGVFRALGVSDFESWVMTQGARQHQAHPVALLSQHTSQEPSGKCSWRERALCCHRC